MTKSLPILGCVIGLLAAGCARQQTVREVSCAREGLTVHAVVSPARNEPQGVVGRIIVRNSSEGFVQYGNMHLFLIADGKRAVTRIRTTRADAAADAVQVDPMADTRLIDLAPGDSLVLASYWRFETGLEFGKTAFSLEYDGKAALPTPSDSARTGDSASTTKEIAGKTGKR